MKNVEIYYGGIKITAGEATPQEVAELKKLLEQQSPYKITWTYPTYPYWTTPYWQQPYYTTTCATNGSTLNGTVYAYNGDPKTNGFNGTTSNDQSCISSNGSLVQNLHLTN